MKLEQIADKLKVALGRKLSPEKMAGARLRKGPEQYYFTVSSDTEKPRRIDMLERLPSGEFVRYKQGFKWDITPDASGGWPHEGYYPYGSVRQLYNQDGLLIEKTISHGSLIFNPYDKKTRVFDPPGRFIGRRIKEE
ncbi:hypothetical protein J4422_03945 [Candidatus Pacearchaeota archaeon]|nr:hypothetical protein [Candidatus Pacearchaeota archaeon]